MQRFNVNLTGEQYDAMTPEDQRAWDRALIEYWTVGDQRQLQRDYDKDDGVRMNAEHGE